MFNKKVLSLSIIAILSSGCATTHTRGYEKSRLEHEASAKKNFDETVEKLKPKLGTIGEEKSGYFVNKDNFYVEKKKKINLPLTFREKISFSVEEDISTNNFAAQVFRITGIQLDFLSNDGSKNTNDSDKVKPAFGGITADSSGVFDLSNNLSNPQKIESKIKPFSFNGTIEEMINYVSIINDLKWKYDEKAEKVFFYNFASETFYVYEKNLDIKSTNKITTDSSGDSESGSVGNKQDIEFKKDESAWSSIEDGVNKFISSKGKVSFNRRQGTITVQDNDYSLAKIREYVQEINKEATRSITIDVSILNVTLNDGNSMGINWSYVNDSLKSNILGGFDLSSQLGSAFTGDSYGNNLLSLTTSGGLKALVGMLGTVGSVSIQSSQTFPTLNNTPISMQVTRNEKYIASIDRTTEQSTGDKNVQTTTDTVKDGITLTLTPRIIGEEVSIDYSMSLNVHDGFAPSPVSEVQLPISSNKNFNQSVIAKNGQTTVIMAFNKQTDRTKSQSPFSDSLWFFGGNESYEAQKEVVVITGTPYFSMK